MDPHSGLSRRRFLLGALGGLLALAPSPRARASEPPPTPAQAAAAAAGARTAWELYIRTASLEDLSEALSNRSAAALGLISAMQQALVIGFLDPETTKDHRLQQDYQKLLARYQVTRDRGET